MINIDKKEKIKTIQINLEACKESYIKKIDLYNLYFKALSQSDNKIVESPDINKLEIKKKLNIFKNQLQKINYSLELVQKIINDTNSQYTEIKLINRLNRKYNEVKDNYLKNCLIDDKINVNSINSILAINLSKEHFDLHETISSETTNILTTIESNNTLLISEKLDKVILPYTSKEISDILSERKNQFQNAEDVIEKLFTRPLSDFKCQFASRYRESMNLARNREKFSLLDSLTLAFEMTLKRYLHPAIIAACRNLNELDVYLDCLDKNELDDFKIFKIKYELYPVPVKATRNKINKIYNNTLSTKDTIQ